MTVGRKGVLELHSSNLPRFYLCFIRRSIWSFPLGIHPELSRLLAACLHMQKVSFIQFPQLLIHCVHNVRLTHPLSWSIHPWVILHSFTSSSSSCLCDRCTTPFATATMIWRKCAPGASRCRSEMHLRLWQRRDIEWCARALIAYRTNLSISSREVFGFDRVSVSAFMMLVASAADEAIVWVPRLAVLVALEICIDFCAWFLLPGRRGSGCGV